MRSLLSAIPNYPPEDLTSLCQEIAANVNYWYDYDVVVNSEKTVLLICVCKHTTELLLHHRLQPYQIDILLNCLHPLRINGIAHSVFKYAKDLTHEHIEFGLSHDTGTVRWYAVNNPCCTESQKVRYNLQHGGEYRDL